MKRDPSGAVVLAAILSLGSWTVGNPALAGPQLGLALAPGDTAPALAADRLGGGPLRAIWSQSAYTLVNFWATWCEPCRREMPALQDLVRSHPAERLVALGVLLDTASDAAALEFARSMGIEYALLRGSVPLANRWGGIGLLPTSFLVDRRGRIVRRFVGATPEDIRAMVADIERHLTGSPDSPLAPGPAASGG